MWVLLLIVSAALGAFCVSLMFGGDVVGSIICGVVALLGLLGVVISLAVIWTNTKVLLGKAAPVLVVDDEGFTWQTDVHIPWHQVTRVAVETGSSISHAGGVNVAVERGIERAMASGGVGDGEREIHVHVRDREALASTLGKARAIVEPGQEPGTGLVRMILGAIIDGPGFANSARSLQQESERRGIPFQVRADP
ncbi:hypothetical protein [Cumulibacter soli]|uniref:hypothetical protein n=1 Tax=Cumulibacter soli TaxID=2546344 RepID=UPI0014198765|nr:hypothetical protein [Cumulibacter soli]